MNAKTIFSLMCAAAMMTLGGATKDSVGGKTGGRDLFRMDEAGLAKLAEAGDVAAQYAHAYRLLMKGGKKPDMAEVVRWTSKSAESGYVPAQFDLGGILLNGLGGVATNEAAGVEWIRKAADAKPAPDDWNSQKSMADARYELGVCYRDGRGVRKDAKRAFELFNAARLNGKRLGKADVALAECYEKGIGVAKDEVQAEKIYQAVADAGTGLTWHQNADAAGKANEWLWRNGKKDLYGTRFFNVKRGESNPPPPAVCTEPDVSVAPLAAPQPRFLPDAQVVFAAFAWQEKPDAWLRLTAWFGEYMTHGLGIDELAGSFDALGLSTTNLNWIAGTIGGISRKSADPWSEMGDFEDTQAVVVVASFDKNAKPRKSMRRELKKLVRKASGREREEFTRKEPNLKEVKEALPEVGKFDGRIYRLASSRSVLDISSKGDILIAVGDDGLVYCSLDAKTLGRAIRLYRGEERGGFEEFATRGPYMFRLAVPETGALLKRIMNYRTLSEYGAHLFANGARILSSLGRFEVCGKLTEGGTLKVAVRLEVADEKNVEKFAIPLQAVVTVMREAIHKEGPNVAFAYWIVGNLRVLTEGKSIVLETCDKTP
jgi:TPR repeat protein